MVFVSSRNKEKVLLKMLLKTAKQQQTHPKVMTKNGQEMSISSFGKKITYKILTLTDIINRLSQIRPDNITP